MPSVHRRVSTLCLRTLDLRSVYLQNSNTHPLSGPYAMQDTIVSIVALSSKKLLPLFSMGRGHHSTDLEARGQLDGFGSVISLCGSENQTQVVRLGSQPFTR